MEQQRVLTRSQLTTPRAAAVAGVLFSLLLSLGSFFWAPLVFPLWVLLISVYIFLANMRRPQGANTVAIPKDDAL